jgi:hypothetical protein
MGPLAIVKYFDVLKNTVLSLFSNPIFIKIGVFCFQGVKKAAVALGRKLAVIMHRMLITKQAFKLGNPSDEKDQPSIKVA